MMTASGSPSPHGQPYRLWRFARLPLRSHFFSRIRSGTVWRASSRCLSSLDAVLFAWHFSLCRVSSFIHRAQFHADAALLRFQFLPSFGWIWRTKPWARFKSASLAICLLPSCLSFASPTTKKDQKKMQRFNLNYFPLRRSALGRFLFPRF